MLATKRPGGLIVSCFDFIASEQLKVDLDLESVEKILKSLYTHDNSEDLLIRVIDGACSNDFFKNAIHDKINEILDLFLKYLNVNRPTDSLFELLQPNQTENSEKKYMSPQKHMVQVIAKLNCDGCFKNCSQKVISEIINISLEFLNSQDNAEYFVYTMEALLNQGLFE